MKAAVTLAASCNALYLCKQEGNDLAGGAVKRLGTNPDDKVGDR